MALQTPRPPQVPRSLTDVLKVAIKEEVVEEVAEVAIKEENVEEVEEVTEVAINEEEVEEAETEASDADSGWGTAAAPGPERTKAWRERAQRVMKTAWAEMEKEWSSAPCEPCDHSSLLPGVDWCAQCGCPPWDLPTQVRQIPTPSRSAVVRTGGHVSHTRGFGDLAAMSSDDAQRWLADSANWAEPEQPLPKRRRSV